MRATTVEHLRVYQERYRELIITEGLERGERWPDEEQAQATIIQQRLLTLERDGVWGGSDVLAAVRDKLGVTIRIFTAQFQPIVFESQTNSYAMINLFYNGVDHYDSITRVHDIEQLTGDIQTNVVIEQQAMTGQINDHSELPKARNPIRGIKYYPTELL